MCWITCWRRLTIYQRYDKKRQESRRKRAEKEFERRQRKKDLEDHERRIAERLAEIERLILTNDPYPDH
jgi:hypothetical protein